MQTKILAIVTNEKTQKYVKLGFAAMAFLSFFLPGTGFELGLDDVPTVPIN